MSERTDEKVDPRVSSSAAPSGRPSRRGRSVPAVYGGVSLVLVAGALTFALSSPPPTTPPLAAVAPAPQEQLEVERVEQSSQFGEGQGGEGVCTIGADCDGVGEETPPQGAAAEPTSPPPAGDPSVSRAHSWPCVMGEGGPRQTEDPQSPPCFGVRFQGDNGGATSHGVTRDTIRVAVPSLRHCWGYTDAQADCTRDVEVLQAFASHVNSHYELYGRRLELVQVSEPEDDDPASQRAYAADIAAVDPFAVLTWTHGERPFLQALADHRLVSLHDARHAVGERALYEALHPFVWGVYPAVEQAGRATGQLVCRALAGRPARHGGPDVVDDTRRFGIVQQVIDGAPADVTTLVSQLEACSAPHTVRGYDSGTDDRELLLRSLRDDGVTTVVCVCSTTLGTMGRAADAIGYQPEWLLPGFASIGSSESFDGAPDQRSHAFGLVPSLREPVDDTPGAVSQLRLEQHYWYHVLRAERPDWEQRRDQQDHAHRAYGYYAQFLVLAAGIQWAGPQLTPESFAAGLQGVTFPNPGVGRPPWYQPAVGFGPGDHTFNSDFAMVWWDEPAMQDGGRWCYLGDGRRFTADTVPADADTRFFDPEAGCR